MAYLTNISNFVIIHKKDRKYEQIYHSRSEVQNMFSANCKLD